MFEGMLYRNVLSAKSVFLLVILWQPHYGQTEGYKCCPPAEWEGEMHVNAAYELNYFQTVMYTNGSIHIGYSVPLQKIYLGMQLVQNSIFFPNATETISFNATYLYDFYQGVLYEVTSIDNNCTKEAIPVNSTQQCVPADAVLLSKSWLGDGRQTSVSTYKFTIPSTGLPWHVRATVHETESAVCEPVYVVYATDVETEIGGIMYSFDIFDIRPIASTDIFKIPKQCLNCKGCI